MRDATDGWVRKCCSWAITFSSVSTCMLSDFIGAVAVVLHHGFSHFYVMQPGFYRRHFFQAGRVEHRAHRAAIRMPANDDVLHAQGQHRVLDGGGNTTVHLAVRRNNVAHVTGHKQIARCALGDQFRHDARIGAGNKHRPRALRRGELFERRLLVQERFRDGSAKSHQRYGARLRRHFRRVKGQWPKQQAVVFACHSSRIPKAKWHRMLPELKSGLYAKIRRMALTIAGHCSSALAASSSSSSLNTCTPAALSSAAVTP
jgi:hypothetical protein